MALYAVVSYVLYLYSYLLVSPLQMIDKFFDSVAECWITVEVFAYAERVYMNSVFKNFPRPKTFS